MFQHFALKATDSFARHFVVGTMIVRDAFWKKTFLSQHIWEDSGLRALDKQKSGDLSCIVCK